MTTPCFILFLLCAAATLATSSTGFRVQLTHVGAGTRIPRRYELVSGATVAPVFSVDTGFYIAEFGIGHPPQAVQAVVSTSTDVVSTQCSTCRPKCFGQNLEYYDYKKSSTGKPAPCGHIMCPQPCVVAADDDDSACRVHVSGIPAVVRADEISFGPAAAKANLTFACTGQTNIAGDFYGGASGLLGLGRGASSLVSQLGIRRFSYCLTRYGDRLDYSTLFLGSSASLSVGHAPVTSTRLAANPSGYYIAMTGISVGEAPLDVPREAFRGGVIIDSTFPYMSLVDVAYAALKKELARQLGGSLRVPPTDGGFLELCMARGDVSLLIEPLVLHLGGGGGLPLAMQNLWVPVDIGTQRFYNLVGVPGLSDGVQDVKIRDAQFCIFILNKSIFTPLYQWGMYTSILSRTPQPELTAPYLSHHRQTTTAHLDPPPPPTTPGAGTSTVLQGLCLIRRLE